MQRTRLLLLMLLWPICSTAAVESGLSANDSGDFKIGPEYQNAAELTPMDGVPRGVIHNFVMNSEDSKLYPGLKGSYTRKVFVYVPAQYVPGTPAPVMIVQDASWHDMLPKVLDNLIYSHKVPAMVVVFIASGGGDGKGSERGFEYDAVTERYSKFIELEVLPRVARDYKITFTKDPAGRATAGGSSGAACAFTMAWFHPELYHRVLSYSGTFVDQQSPFDPKSPHGAWEYHEHFIPESDPRPIRIWMEVGEKDNNMMARDPSGRHNWPEANRRMAAVLKAKGYQYRYVFAIEAKHVDPRVVRQTLPEAMVWLWSGYPAK